MSLVVLGRHKDSHASADGAIAAVDFVGVRDWNVDGISQLAAVAVRIVRSEAEVDRCVQSDGDF